MSKALLILALCLLPGFVAAQQPVEVTAAMEDLARRLAVPVTEIALASREQATWPDTSLGCPQPGSAYAQVLVPGYRLLLRVGGQEYEYHSDRKGQVVFCSRNIVNTTEIPAVVERARLDLARRLGCTPAEITVVETPFVEWPAPAFQRPEQLNEVPLRTTPGYRPILRCNGTEYAYQTDLLQEARFEQELPPGSNEAYRLAYLQV